jgi:protein-L-isoaspartate(D-aspartate) O-methyltransferase
MPCPSSDDYRSQRTMMVEQQLRARGIIDAHVLHAMGRIPREAFVPPEYRMHAYRDGPLSIGDGQTISQPYIVALMTELLNVRPDDRVLEIGTGSGYQYAVLQSITPHVYSIERIGSLAVKASSNLRAAGIAEPKIKVSDGTLGWLEEAPFNAIIVTSAAPEVPEPLACQLTDGGRLVVPLGNRSLQTLVRIERSGDVYKTTEHGGCVFVPLIGEYGWPEE